MTDWEKEQKNHHDNIASDYDLHFADKYSGRYREKFYHAPLTKGLDLNGMRVLEAMCGPGQVTDHLLSLGAKVVALDISSGMVEAFVRRWPNCEAVCASIFDTGFENESFDCIVLVAGLHHLHPDLNKAMDEIYRILKPGGYFLFIEPHAGSFPDIFRRLWYKHDSFFVKNEQAIDLVALMRSNEGRFQFINTRYGGGLAYLLVANSMVFRMPQSVKNIYSLPLIVLEAILQPFRTKLTSCFVVCQWSKK